jgi:hypothetical protein
VISESDPRRAPASNIGMSLQACESRIIPTVVSGETV